MSFAQQVNELRGAFSAIFTPFDAGNRVDFDKLTAIAEFQLQAGLTGFFVTGSTGEGLLLNYEERAEVIEHMVVHFGERAKIIAHVGHPSTDFASELARDAAEAGAHWISAVGPVYHGTTIEGTFRHYRQIAAATDLPFMVYALGVDVDPDRDARLFEIPNVAGMKYTGANFFSVQQLANRIERPVAWISGFDEQFVAGQLFGFQGGIGSTYNFAPRFYAQMFELCQAGDFPAAAKLQAQINRVTHLMAQHENWSYRKAIMRYVGIDVGPCRAPYAPLTEEEYAAFAEQLDALDVLQRDEAINLTAK